MITWCPHVCVLLSIGERCEWKELWRQGGEEIFVCKAKEAFFVACIISRFFSFCCF
jgi:hypothetical protein